MTNSNQKRAEKPFVKEVQTPVYETVNPEGEEELVNPPCHCALNSRQSMYS